MRQERLPVFVYGTLRPGEKNYSRFLAGRTADEVTATAAGELFFVAAGGYPYVVPGPGRVKGKLVHLDPSRYEQTLREIDTLEEYDPGDEAHSLYLRRSTTVTLTGGGRTAAWIYYWNGPPTLGTRIASGDFRDRPA